MLFADLMPLFAQAGRPFGGPGGGNQQGPPPEVVGGIILTYVLCIGFLVLVSYTIRIFFCLSMSKCLKEIAPRNRTAEPGSVWLCLIPLVGFIFSILTMFRVPESVKNEYDDRGWRGDGDFGKQWAIIYLIGIFVAGPLALVALIIFWSKVSGYTKEMMSRPAGRGYDDEDDDRPRRRSKRRRDEEDDDEDR